MAAFDAAYIEAAGRAPGPASLADRLCRAAVAALAVDGAVLTCAFTPDRPVPVAISSSRAGAGERAQFAVGAGPGMTAQAEQRLVCAVGHDLRFSWPVLAGPLSRRASYRGALALPVPGDLAQLATFMVFAEDGNRLGDLSPGDVTAVAAAIGHKLLSALDSDQEPVEGLPAWFGSPSALARHQVWAAVGYLMGARACRPDEALSLLRSRSAHWDTDLETTSSRVLAGGSW